MKEDNEYDFSGCNDPEAAANKFFEKVNGFVFTVEGEPEIEFCANHDPDDKSVILVGHLGDNSMPKSADDVVRKIYKKVKEGFSD